MKNSRLITSTLPVAVLMLIGSFILMVQNCNKLKASFDRVASVDRVGQKVDERGIKLKKINNDLKEIIEKHSDFFDSLNSERNLFFELKCALHGKINVKIDSIPYPYYQNPVQCNATLYRTDSEGYGVRYYDKRTQNSDAFLLWKGGEVEHFALNRLGEIIPLKDQNKFDPHDPYKPFEIFLLHLEK